MRHPPEGLKGRYVVLRYIRILAFSSLSVLSWREAFGQDIAAGEQIAKSSCAGCHSVDSNREELRNEAVPSFSAIARSQTTSRVALEKFISTHPKMREYTLTREQIRDVAAYILSLRNPAAR